MRQQAVRWDLQIVRTGWQAPQHLQSMLLEEERPLA
jgi:hypothetical protein